MKNRLKAFCILLIIFCIFLVFYIFKIYGIAMPCLIKSAFHISCPTCGMTRAFYSMFHLDFVEAIRLNILSIPLASLIVISIIVLIFDMIFGSDKFIQNIKKFFNSYYILIILSLVISMMYSNIMKI